jgi:hypothetical protein
MCDNISFKTRAKFFLLERKTEWDEVGGRILLGDNTGRGAVMS